MARSNMKTIVAEKANVEEWVSLLSSNFTEENHQLRIRLDVTNDSECDLLLKEINQLTGQKYLVKYTKSVNDRLAWRRIYKCSIATNEKRCNATLDIKLKKIPINTKKRDRLVSQFPCVMVVSGAHNHEFQLQRIPAPEPITVESDYTCQDCNKVEEWAHLFANKELRIRMRLNLNKAEELMAVMKRVRLAANVNFVVTSCNKRNFQWRKKFICHHGGRAKTKHNGCKVVMVVRKLANEIEFSCLVQVDGTHSHDLNSVESLKRLPISSLTKQKIRHYFTNGVPPATAMREISKDLTEEERANSSKNPKLRTYYYWYNRFQQNKFGNIPGVGKNEVTPPASEHLSQEGDSPGSPVSMDQEETVQTAVTRLGEGLRCATEPYLTDPKVSAGINVMTRNLTRMKSASDLACALHSFGKDVILSQDFSSSQSQDQIQTDINFSNNNRESMGFSTNENGVPLVSSQSKIVMSKRKQTLTHTPYFA